uniref:PawS-like protein 1a n=1 Tax=Pentanema ensifolium TaxID=1522193 RepID=A0A1V0JB46_9ASTR|nr:PawS-like protein 1a [Inula ensifolia]
MANQLALVAVLALAAIVAFADEEVSAYRTTITTTTTTTTIEDNGFPPYVDGLPTEVVEDNPRERERCRKQIQGQQLNHCHMHLVTQGTASSFDDSMLRRMTQQEEDQHLQLCCDQLKQVNEQCQCEAIKKVVQQAAQMQQQQQQVLRNAQMLPNQCKQAGRFCKLIRRKANIYM